MMYRHRKRYKARHADSVYGGKRITDWLESADRPEGMNQTGKKFFLELKDIDKRMARNNTILYFLLMEYGMQEMRTMMISTSRVRSLIYKIMVQLKGWKDDDGDEHPGHAVMPEWISVFQKNIDSFSRRADYVFAIIKKDLEETELYPYFREVGFDRLVDFGVRYPKDKDEQARQLKEEIEQWNAEHQDEVDAHMAVMAPQIQARDAHRKKVAEDRAAEKQARRLAKKAETAEVREIRENNRKYWKQVKKENRDFERYYIN